VPYPRRLTSKRGGPKAPPRKVAEAFVCPECGARLERHGRMWQGRWMCPRALSHTKIITDDEMLRRVRRLVRKAGYRRWTAEGLLYVQARVAYWSLRNEADEQRSRRLRRHLDRVLTELAEQAGRTADEYNAARELAHRQHLCGEPARDADGV